MRLLIDDMYPAAIGDQLSRLGHDVKCVSAEAELRSLPDGDVWAVAQSERRIVVTENIGDFARLADAFDHTAKSHFGVIFIHPTVYPRGLQRSVGRIVKALDTVLTEHRGHEPEGVRLSL